MNKTQFLISHGTELKEALTEFKKKTIPAIEKLTDEQYEAIFTKLCNRYDEIVITDIECRMCVPDTLDEDYICELAENNEWQNGTEPIFVIDAIRDITYEVNKALRENV